MSARLVIVGAGGHAKIVIDTVRQINRVSPTYSIVGLVDDVTGTTELCGFPVASAIEQFDSDCFVVAIGDNKVRKEKFEQLVSKGLQAATIMHPGAIVSPDAKIGEGTLVVAGAVINIAATVGSNCIINTTASIDHDCAIGNHCHIGPGAVLAGNVVVGEGAFLGIGTKVIPHVCIGDWATAGAGAVLVGNVSAGAKVVGVPARPI